MSANLKRSQKTDFATASVMRERSFVKPSKDALKRRSQTMASIRASASKPTMEIYRPPNVRSDVPGGKLNVHAKEFTMNELQASKSSGNILTYHHSPVPLQQSKSSGSILRHYAHPGTVGGFQLSPIIAPPMPIQLVHSSSQILQPSAAAAAFNAAARLNFHHHYNEILSNHPVFTGHNQPTTYYQQHHPVTAQNHQQQQQTVQQLKRSKSLGASDSNSLTSKLKTLTKEETDDLGVFSPEDQTNLKLAVEDPNQLPSRTLMDLVKIIMDRVVEGIRYCEAGAKLCIAIIEREKNQTFLESLLNTCQQWYQERDKLLRGIKAGDGTRFTSFMWFLTEMCGQLKRHQLKGQFENLQPELVLLSVLTKCCQACVQLPIKCHSETECLFFVLTSIGRDLQEELPSQLEQLLGEVRDGFLACACSQAVRRTLLQLIELHASNWQLPGSSVLYYYPRIK